MDNNTNQQRCSSLDEIFGTAKTITSSIDGLVDVANMAYRTGCNVINNATQFQQGYPQNPQQSQFFYDNNSRRNQFPNGYTTPNPVPNYGYGYGNITNNYNSFGMFSNMNMNGMNNIGYPGIANPGYGMLASY